MNPMYELVFHGKKIKMTRNVGEMVRQIDEVFPGNEGGYARYIEETRRKLSKLAAFTFQAKYLGMNPWESPGAFSI